MGTHNTDGVVVEAHADAVGYTDEVGRIDEYLTVDLRMDGGALDGQLAFAVALETHDLIGHEAIEDGEGHTGHREDGIDSAFALILITAVEQSEFLVVEHQAGVDGVGVILLHQVDELRADIADG